MSRYIYILLALLFTSCAGFMVDDIPQDVVTRYSVSISAAAGSDTRLAVDDLSLTWEDTDLLAITAVAADGTYANSELAVYEIDANNRSRASFSGFVSMLSAPQECYFLYPNSAATSYNPSTGRVKFQYNSQTGRHEPFLYAKTGYNPDGMHVSLEHVGAVLQLSVDIPGVSSITFAGNKLENIYPVEVNPDNDEVFFSNEVGVQITVPVQSEGPTYICVPPVNLEKGFSLICSKPDGSYLVKSFSSDGSLSGGYDFSTKVGSLIPIELTGNFESFQISATGLSGNHTKNGNLLTGTEVKFTMNKSGSSNKLIEEWGANLLNTDGQVVRTVKFTNETPIIGQTVSMNIANNWKLLPAGQYVFTPYYKMYGQNVTLASQILSIADPGVVVTIEGSTSYDKYIAGNVSGANSHTNTLIEGVAVATNLDQGIIDSSNVTLDGASLGNGTWSSGKMTFGNQTKTSFKSYKCIATIKVGSLTYTSSRDFHITGLPYEINFANGDDSSWAKLGGAKYSSKRIQYEANTTSAKDGAVVSPKFNVPGPISICTAVDACARHTQAGNRTMYISATKNNTSIVKGTSTVTAEYKVSYASTGYTTCDGTFTLNSTNPYMIYTASPTLYSLALFKVKIQYK